MSAKSTQINHDGTENEIDITSYAQSMQLGISLGIGYKLEISKEFSLLLDYQEFYGLTNISRINGLSLKNSCSGFNLGGVFTLN